MNFDIPTKDKITPLMLSCLKCTLPIIKLLLSITKNVNATDISGNTALHYAMVFENKEIISNLLNHPYININLKNKE